MRIYIASPISTYLDIERYSRFIKRVYKYFSGAEIFPACDLYKSTIDWLEKWPRVLPNLDILVFFTDRQGWIGAGVYSEIVDCLASGKSVYYLDEVGKLIPYEQVRLTIAGDSFKTYARVEVLP